MHLDNWLFLVFLGGAMLLRLIGNATSKARKDPGEDERRSTTTPPPSLRPTRGDSQEEQIRKFLEALGRPSSSSPPPVVKPRTDIPPRPVAPITPPREMVATAPRRREVRPAPKIRTQEQAPRRAEPPPVPVEAQPLPTMPVTSAYDIPVQTEVVRRETKIDIVNLLRSPSGLRDAMVLREIFGPPRSMQDVDLVGIA